VRDRTSNAYLVRPVKSHGLHGLLCLFVLSAGAVASTPNVQRLSSPSEPVLSTSGQFVIRAPSSAAPAGNALVLAPERNLVRLEPAFVSVSCERIKQALFRDIGPNASWQGRINVEVHPARAVGQRITITSERFRNGWQYQVGFPDTVERDRYTRVMVQVLLLEFANRGSSGGLAEIPAWLTEGLTQRLLASKDIALIVPPPREAVNGLSFSATRITERLDDPVGHARQQLHGQVPLTFDQLSWQVEDELSGPAAELYRTSAQLFVGELLHLRDGRACLTAMLAGLPRYHNWQLAFLEAFRSHFERSLDVEKWWALCCCVQSAAKEFVPKVPIEGPTWYDLDQALLTTAPDGPGMGSSSGHTEVTLQTIIREWDRVEQFHTLSGKVQELGLLRPRLSPDLALLVQEYCQAVGIYLQTPHWNRMRTVLGPKARLSPAAQDALERLDALDARREALRPAKAPVTAGDVTAAPGANPDAQRR
jgi:hypothetical protein